LTWLSLMTDGSLYGDWPGGYHLTNVALHLSNVVLLFAMLTIATRQTGRSAFTAALFAVHPLHVESVAWVTERKDVLSVFFGLATVWAYARYVEAPSWGVRARRYLLMLTAYAASLAAKPMLITLPLVLLLLDYWPLRRLWAT